MTVGRYARWTSVILFLLLSLSTLFCSLPAGAASSQKTLSGLSPAAMISRAREWVAADVPYSQSVAPSERFQNYRADCSGLVSMAWGIPAIPPNYGLNTTGLSQAADLLGKALDVTGKPIMDTMNKLQPGDILLNQGEDAHVILFVGWINIATKKVVSTPVQNTQDGNYYYDGIEENGDAGAIEHTSTHTLNSDPFDYSQPWPFPYYPGYNSQGYYAWRFDTTKAAQLGYETIQPSGEWMPPSPKDGDVITSDTLHLAATAYPTHKGDPPIAAVYFTLEFKGTWRVVCSPTTPSKSGSIYTCDANLPQLGISPGQVQVSFDVYDTAGGFNLAPNGVHTLTYVHPTPTPEVKTVEVSSTQGWQDTGVVVNVGNQVVIHYLSGLWTDQDSIPPYDAAGDPSGYTCANYIPASQCVEPVPDAVKGSLVGMIGTQLLKIGDHLSFTATQGGSLLLRMNDSDDGLYDNQGSITVQIEVS